MTLSEELQARGFVNQFTAETVAEITDGAKRTVYLGVDPTADSMHAGNFAIVMLLRHFVEHGHKVIFVSGGGTGMIGDPKPDVERTLGDPEEIKARADKLKSQAMRLLDSQEVTFVNNYDWLSKLDMISFLRDVGKHFTVNELIKKDAISSRLESEVGLSYTEFAYPLLQAYDFLTLHREHDCDVQVGGSDQWGNLVAGVDLIRKKEQATVYALTVPLVIDKATGKKFGKSEGNAVWLDAEKTSPYQFYQFWLNVSDESVIDYLKLFTVLPLGDIEAIEQAFRSDPGSRSAQKALAHAVTAIVHSDTAADGAAKVSALLFGEGSLSDLSTEEQNMLVSDAPTHSVIAGTILVDVLVESGLASSKREARTFIESGAIELSGEKVTDVEFVFTAEQFTNNLAILKRGKKQQMVLRLAD